MQELILAQLVTKNAGVSKVVLGLIAKKIAEKVTEESQIEGAIADFEEKSVVSVADYAALLQSETDRRVTEALKKAKEPDTPPNPADPPKPAESTDVAGLIAAEVAKALAPIQALTGQIQNSTKINGVKAKLKAKGIAEDWADDIVIGEDFDEEATVARLEKKWNDAKQAIINTEVGEGRFIKGSGGGGNANFEQSVKDWNVQSAPSKENGYNIQEV